jgi:hypothetical protein
VGKVLRGCASENPALPPRTKVMKRSEKWPLSFSKRNSLIFSVVCMDVQEEQRRKVLFFDHNGG